MRSVGTPFSLVALSSFALAGETHLTIYNQNFAVVRDDVPLALKPGANRVTFAETTAHLEPDSVILRDPSGKNALQILEQNYRADPISQELLLSLFEGQSIPFLVHTGEKQEQKIGRILRSGYEPHARGLSRYGQEYAMVQSARAYGGGGQPIIEMDGSIRFGLPGTPLFPSLGTDTILKPSIDWVIETNAASAFTAELCYVTGGMGWQADYNVVSPETSDVLDLVGWVTIDNQSGKTFTDARLKLMAGDVSKIQPGQDRRRDMRAEASFALGMAAPVTEKAFDEFHLYSIARPTTVRDRETKQVEFVRSAGVASTRLYVYDGAFIDPNMRNWDSESIRSNEQYGSRSNPKVWVMREFVNSAENKLGIALPKGRVRFYRRDSDGQLEFTGENLIDHTPKDETLRIYTGNAFDVVGERKRTDFKRDSNDRWLDETFEIELRNHKKEAVEVRVVEHLYRWVNWEIAAKSDDFWKTESQEIEFRVTVPADGVRKVSYRVHYSW